jgi:hypothetical protein
MQSGRAITAAVAGATIGACAMAGGAAAEEIGLAVVGAAFFIVASMAACLVVLIRQIADTSAERTALVEQHESYIAAEAGVLSERERLRKDRIKSAALAQQTINRERQALRQQYEEERFTLAARAYQLGAEAAMSGSLSDDAEFGGTVVRLPVWQRSETTAMAASDD